MCRHAAYLGPECALDTFLTAPEHSLVVQSHSAKELETALVCADGYGFGWFDGDATPGHYRSTLPIWQDPNLAHLGAALARRVWVANVRSATPPLPVSHENTHPFAAHGLLFSHNGYIEQFLETVRPRLRALLPPDVDAEVRGSTDAELLFALVERHRRDAEGLPQAIRLAFETLAAILPRDADALLNVIAATPDMVVATRHAIGQRRSPSLHVAEGHAAFPGASLVASEPLDSDSAWSPVPDGHLAVLTAGGVALEPL